LLAEYFALASLYCANPRFALAIMKVETNFKNVVSQEGSIGLMQVRLSTAKWIGCKIKTKEDLENENLNVSCACLYIEKLSLRYDRLEDIAAAYNAGSALYCKTGKLTPSGKSCQIGKYINQDYVNKVMRSYNEFQKF
jgi:soluble lytic murein transglycosylase-like protein